MGNGGTITIKFNANTSSFTSALKQAENQIKGFAEKNKSSFSSIAKTADGLADKMTGMLKTFSALSAAGGVSVAAFTKSAGELQSLRASFSSLTGTVEETNKVMNTLYQYGKMTAFDNASIQQSAKMFLANGVAVDDLMGWMKNLGDVAGATGSELTSLALPLTQAISKGKLQTQDWYQIINQGAGGLQKYIIAALGAGYSQENFGKALESGAVTTDVLRTALEMASAEGGMAFEGAKKQSETYAGRLSNLQEQITNTGLAILGVDAATGEVKADGLFAKISDAVKNATKWLEDNKQTILDVAGVVVDNLIPGLASLAVVWTTLKSVSVISSMVGAFSAVQTAISGATTVAGAFNAVLALNPIGIIVVAIGLVIAALTFLQMRFNIFGTLFEWLGSLFGTIGAIIGGAISVVVEIVSGAISAVMSVISPIIDFVSGVVSTIVQFFVGFQIALIAIWAIIIESIINVVVPIVSWIFNNIIAPIAGFFSGLWNGIVAGVSGFVQGAMNIIMPIANWINSNIIQPISRFFTGLWNGVVSGIKGMADGIRTAFSSILGIIKAPINGLISLINGVIGGINRLKVPDWVPGLGGMSPNIPRIPMLAKGGVVESATIAMIGEAGKEVVMPLENNTGWISNLASQIAERGGVSGEGVEVHIGAINIQTDGGNFTDDDAVIIAKKIANAVRSQGLRIDQMGALR